MVDGGGRASAVWIDSWWTRAARRSCRGGPDGGAVNRRADGGRLEAESHKQVRTAAATCDDAGEAPLQEWTAKQRCRAGSAEGVAGRWTRAKEQPSGCRGPSAAFSLPLPSPALAVNDLCGRFPVLRGYLGGDAIDFRGATLLLAPFPRDRQPVRRRKGRIAVVGHKRPSSIGAATAGGRKMRGELGFRLCCDEMGTEEGRSKERRAKRRVERLLEGRRAIGKGRRAHAVGKEACERWEKACGRPKLRQDEQAVASGASVCGRRGREGKNR
ncbi:hypothetical protein BDA96_04G135200 [Sorghum bicolor]|uniref:Uncharacterized protein n=1 Tax=Sorghum bicolor TaxID=4558 RepID=A0A921UIE1_SORBI|nr:hypothetical protein BDA96_04G135200 [Sorghum bicolor]